MTLLAHQDFVCYSNVTTIRNIPRNNVSEKKVNILGYIIHDNNIVKLSEKTDK